MKHKGRYILALLIVLILATKSNAKSTIANNCEIYTVQPGETLWQIAGHYDHKDIRDFIADIRSVNNISAVIQPGQELKIPIESR